MSLFEAMYGRKCNTPVSWDNPTNKVVIGSGFLKEMEEKMENIKQNLKATRDGFSCILKWVSMCF
jgi:hypothetical protein